MPVKADPGSGTEGYVQGENRQERFLRIPVLFVNESLRLRRYDGNGDFGKGYHYRLDL